MSEWKQDDNIAKLSDALLKAMLNPDELVIELIYLDRHGRKTKRVVSPIRYIDEDSFLALCLCREEPRQFRFDQCMEATLKQASDYLMPVPIEHLTHTEHTLQ